MIEDYINQINSYSQKATPFLMIVDFEIKQPLIWPIDQLPENILFQTPSYRNFSTEYYQGKDFNLKKYPLPFSEYMNAFTRVKNGTLAGKTYLLNLTFPTRIESDQGLQEIFHASKAMYKLLYENRFVVFSPEIFVQIHSGKIFSCPMKGTIDADIPGAEEKILSDEKEMAEHVTIVDLIRNDMSKYADQVKVEKFRYIERIETNQKPLLQVSSKISGRLPANYREILGDIIFSMLPAGSVSGAPKKETLRIIREAEEGPRGYYTGIMGYFDGRDFESAVLIRFIENNAGILNFRSGGGITFMSDPRLEYQELLDKVYIPLTD